VAIHFHELMVKEVRPLTANCIGVVLEVPAPLATMFSFVQGQNISLKATINQQTIRRSYSIYSAPHENELCIAIKKVQGGLFSTWAHQHLTAGQTLAVMPPTGKFNTPLHAANKKHYLAFAAGSGITPIIAIIKATLHQEPHSHFTLVYGNQRFNSIIFFEALAALKNKYLERFNLINILSREEVDTPLYVGRINQAKLIELGKLISYTSINEFFICGPAKMIFCVKDYLEALGINKKYVHFELFANTPPTQQSTLPLASNENIRGSQINIKLDGRKFQFYLAFHEPLSILEAALQQQTDVPFACKGGMCCTCKARLMAGTVSMNVHWGLEEEEIAQGYILTCQAHPTSPIVEIDFDVK
jgi:ring-1,2-phenylacetyl-CoA epoxidase subunit PaaE